MSELAKKHPHYHKDVRHLESIDVYRVLALFNVTDPCIQHAVKKLLVAGGRGAGKDIVKDVKESIDSLARWQEMKCEEANRGTSTTAALTPSDYNARRDYPDFMAGDMVGTTDAPNSRGKIHSFIDGNEDPQGNRSRWAVILHSDEFRPSIWSVARLERRI